ncbi:MAG TPA: type III pantothenate kinase [Candidatus Butyricicoccus stercorigallinarum]|nr:type III pantothenate kinase [Candidatus Butyricicoccus stercorigallinarum]
MLLTIDVGNTNTVFGIYRKEEMIGSFRLSTTAERTSDEIGMKIHLYYSFLGLNARDTRAVIIASVVPPVMYTLINAIRKYIGVQPLIVGQDIETGLVNRYDNPKEVGIDRLVNAVSAVKKYGSPLIIIDIGTATTFDVIDGDGAYRGGAIYPGIKVAMEALFQKASKLPRVDIVRPDKAIGTNTVMSMQSGAVRGYAGAIQGIVGEMQQEIGCKCNVVATGGMGRMMAQYCDTITHVDANLTLEGLLMLYQANRDKFDAVKPLGALRVSADEEVEARL